MSRRRRHSTGRQNARSGPPAAKQVDPAVFWGRPDESWPPVSGFRTTTQPGALPQSLGALPLSGNRAAADRSLHAVYEEAVRTAAALAAAGGLLLEEDDGADPVDGSVDPTS